jgi:hypothetical protein
MTNQKNIAIKNKKAEMKDLIKIEYARCATDPAYFMKKYCRILHPKQGLIKFNLYDFQEETVSEFLKHRWNIILKARQLGISTLTSAYATWLMLFRNDKTILIIANKARVANSMVYKIRTIYKYLPKWLKRMAEGDDGNLPIDTKSKLQFRNGSTVEASSATEDAGRSDALSLLIWDECAIVKERLAKEIWTAASNTLAEGGDCIILSTPKGVGNVFHELWVDAEAGENEFNTIRLPWYRHPNRDQAYRDKEDKKMGEKAAAQEHDCSFLTSGDSVVELEIIEEYRKNHVIEPIEKRYAGKFWIWKYPEPKHQYIVSVDVSRGDSADKSAFHIWDVETLEQVGEYVGLIDAYDLGAWTVSVSIEYNNALLVIENNGLGLTAVEAALHKHYPNLYYSGRGGEGADIAKRVKMLLQSNDNKIPGFSNTMRTRPLMINKMERFFREREIIVHSSRLLNELTTFVYKSGGKAEAIGNKHDDLVLSAAMGLYVRDTAITLLTESRKSTKRMLNYTGKLSSKQMYKDDNDDDPWKANVNGYKMNLRDLL